MPSAKKQKTKGAPPALINLALIAFGLMVVIIGAQSAGIFARLLDW